MTLIERNKDALTKNFCLCCNSNCWHFGVMVVSNNLPNVNKFNFAMANSNTVLMLNQLNLAIMVIHVLYF